MCISREGAYGAIPPSTSAFHRNKEGTICAAAPDDLCRHPSDSELGIFFVQARTKACTHTDFSLDDDDDTMTITTMTKTTMTSAEETVVALLTELVAAQQRIAAAQERLAAAQEQQVEAAKGAPTWTQASVLALLAFLVSLVTLLWPSRPWARELWEFWRPGSAYLAAKAKAKEEAKAKKAAERELEEEEERAAALRPRPPEAVAQQPQPVVVRVGDPAAAWRDRMRPRRGGYARGEG